MLTIFFTIALQFHDINFAFFFSGMEKESWFWRVGLVGAVVTGEWTHQQGGVIEHEW